MKTKRAKATDISQAVKRKVFERDNGCCVVCGNSYNVMPNAHFIPRSKGGLGIEENILTLCPECHWRYDRTFERAGMGAYFRDYLRERYPGWDETKLIYRKGEH